MRRVGEIQEIILVDDGCSDATPLMAAQAGVTVMPSGGRLGPGGARNAAAAAARGEVLWFVDADAVVHADAARVLSAALADSDVVAVFGAYDDQPSESGFWSQYKNLVHHHYHRNSSREAETFWAGCGAIRKAAFFEAGGFDQERYAQPSIEDIELGWRLRQRGWRIQLEPAIQATHLKKWELGNLLRTEIFFRALPWSRLIHGRTGLPDALNVSRIERCRALLAMALLASLTISPLWISVAMLALAMVANRGLVAVFARRRGMTFAVAAVLFHQVYYWYSSSAFVWAWIEHRWAISRKAIADGLQRAPFAESERFGNLQRPALIPTSEKE